MNEAKGEAPSFATVPDDPLQPPVCIGCGYELTGLVPDCLCPECGVQRDPGMIVLRGFAVGRRRTLLTGRVDRHLKWWNWIGMVFFAVVVLYFTIYEGLDSLTSFAGAVVQLIMMTVLIGIAYHRQRSEGLLPVHAIIHPEGVCQRPKFGQRYELTKLNYELAVEFDVTKDGFQTLKITQQDVTTFYASMAKYQPVAIKFRANEETLARVRATLNGEKP